ncbi:MAG TPA: FkbM family methyltransferase [Candidatus Eisenbacteria bacterium]|nr:FkbM family methyltransferase [Candidatus Eisenbacteria bacterium]
MIRRAGRAIVGTRWEAPAKRLYAALTGEKSYLYDYQTIAIMRRVLTPDANAIDAGAFEGGMLRHLCRIAPRGHHLAFEPNPEKFKKLQAAFPGVRVLPYALGERAGEVPFHRAIEHPALSGLRHRAKYWGENEPTEEIRVPMETLDRVVPPDDPLAFVKVDVEGGELGLLQGGVGLLRRWRPVIVFESGLGGADYFETRPEAIYDLLAETIGLKVSLLGAWLDGAAPLSRQGFVDQFEEGRNYYFVAHP